MKKILRAFLLCTLVVAVGLSSPAGASVWSFAYSLGEEEFFESVAAVPAGGWIAAGRALVDRETGEWDAWVVRLDDDGAVIWETLIDTYQQERIEGIAPCADGGFIAAGWTQHRDPEEVLRTDAWVVKLDASGVVEWTKIYAGPRVERLRGVLQTPDGRYAAVGSTSSWTTGPACCDTDAWVLFLDSRGDVVRQYAYGRKGVDAARSVAPAPDGGIVFAGEGQKSPFKPRAASVVKLDPRGRVDWANLHIGIFEWVESVAAHPEGGWVVTGPVGPNYGGLWVLRLDGEGGTVWENEYGTQYEEPEGNAVAVLEGGRIAVAGEYGYWSGIESDGALIVVLNGDGTVWSTRQFSGPEHEIALGIAAAPDGGYLAVGRTSSFGHEVDWQHENGWTLRWVPDGATTYCPPLTRKGVWRTPYESYVVTGRTKRRTTHAVVTEPPFRQGDPHSLDWRLCPGPGVVGH